MEDMLIEKAKNRYSIVTEEKASGATYTPKVLSDFVARQIIEVAKTLPNDRPVRLLDPAVGDGELLLSLLEQLDLSTRKRVEVCGFDTDLDALIVAEKRISNLYPNVSMLFDHHNFLEFVLKEFGGGETEDLFRTSVHEKYDLVIANPPYVRTQIMGAAQARQLSEQFGLTGRVDLYYAFILGMAKVLKPKGIAGIIVSNRFMTTKSGAAVRRALIESFNIQHVWDLGDTKVFDAAVLPAVLLVEGKNGYKREVPDFTSIYETTESTTVKSVNVINALSMNGIVQTDNGRRFQVQHGKLNTGSSSDGVWRIATEAVDTWLATVNDHAWGTFRDIGKIRVGVKTCADKIFIRDDWDGFQERPELLKPLTTHHIARRFKASTSDRPKEILYPHEVVQGKRQTVNLSRYPFSKAYLEDHKEKLAGRKYVVDAGRNWYEIWVAQDPGLWNKPKLVFRDISEKPTFWVDLGGSIVNGDCYWLTCQNSNKDDLLWLAAAVANSTFIEQFYDYRFNNKLYAGRRRFITQYVEKFPLPNPASEIGKAIINKARQTYKCIPSQKAEELEKELDLMVWESFSLVVKEVAA